MKTISFLDELNEVQYKAVTTINGPVMVIAGPGSGKTRVLTYRIAYMMEQGINPRNILTLTFTNKAAREMKERLEKVVGQQSNYVWAGTFHSIFAKILRIEADKIGFPPSFTIYDSDDTKSMLNHIVKDLQLDSKLYTANLLYNRISSAKSQLISPASYLNDHVLIEEDKAKKVPLVGQIYYNYTERCKNAGAMDFDDLLFNTFILFHRNPDNVLEKYQQKFKYLLVDEFQDTNFLQYAILKKLIKYPDSQHNLCIVGDDAQSIYAFRGATIENILDFSKDFPQLQTFKLEQNYRSGQYIVNAANNVINYNHRQIKKEIWTSQADSAKISTVRALSDDEESRKVVDAIFEHKNRNHITNSEIAILYRTNAQSRNFEEHLRRANIPYKIYGGMSFYQRKEVKDLLAYFRLVVNLQDEEAFRRIVNIPKRGIGDTSVEKLLNYATENNINVWDAIDAAIVTGKAQVSLLEFKKLILHANQFSLSNDADKVAELVYQKSEMAKMYKEDKTNEGKSRMEHITSLMDGIQEFVEKDEVELDDNGDIVIEKSRGMVEYLQSISLITDFDNETSDGDHVNLMSVHSSKGLEFDSVFVVGLEEKLFPSFMSLHQESLIDEERRLFYVAITRARKLLTLTYATSRRQFGNIVFNKPSRFLEEVGEDNLASSIHQPRNLVKDRDPRSKVVGSFAKKPIPQAAQTQYNIVASPISAFQPGVKVLHPRFGYGTIISIEGNADARMAIIHFDTFSDDNKRILLKFAKMQAL
ncbi:MAG: UvrD-helicase domain-containing protein [Saprospiraceae bacterium]|jgi:DNA helicase-2/ATP-dependent DNA helicase PcrA|nr:UvrD-helicase domain-containing protein [Saprospiraceae bacterium]MCO5278891.1 UvrD-helicase domain-containing protein [Saprospiraceae bacterium]